MDRRALPPLPPASLIIASKKVLLHDIAINLWRWRHTGSLRYRDIRYRCDASPLLNVNSHLLVSPCHGQFGFRGISHPLWCHRISLMNLLLAVFQCTYVCSLHTHPAYQERTRVCSILTSACNITFRLKALRDEVWVYLRTQHRNTLRKNKIVLHFNVTLVRHRSIWEYRGEVLEK